jgi:hypothetical protein
MLALALTLALTLSLMLALALMPTLMLAHSLQESVIRALHSQPQPPNTAANIAL